MIYQLPLFPLNTVLFPQSELSLRIFELRYRRLLDECGKKQPFGVVRIRYGHEVGEPAFTYDIGTSAYVVQQVALADGSLAVMAVGGRRFRVTGVTVEPDGLTRATIEWLSADPFVAIPNALQAIADTFAECGDILTDAGTLAWRLADALPLSLTEQQELLEENNPQLRLQRVNEWLLKHPFDFIK
ncbi:LON peptidase substrate-binding domain-containing protein [Agitococcus lubricus]|nr:LON peptidase substrate-binding domain-containing protein [Agitococcus lubricus]